MKIKNQTGAVLIISLILLLVMAIFAFGSLAFVNNNSAMIYSDKSRMLVMQDTQTLSDGLLSMEENSPVTGGVGFKVCLNIEGCNQNMVMPTGIVNDLATQSYIKATIQRVEPELGLPFRGGGTSLKYFATANFVGHTDYENSDVGGGKMELRQGVMVLLTKN